VDHEKEIRALTAETLAIGYVLGSVLSRLARNPALRPAIIEGFDQSLDIAQSVAIQFGRDASPEHTVKAFRIVEEMRAMVLGNDDKPKHVV
jgi:hypothetical protein